VDGNNFTKVFFCFEKDNFTWRFVIFFRIIVKLIYFSMDVVFNKLKKSIGKKLKFNVAYVTSATESFTDVFYATVKEVEDNFIIVEQIIVLVGDNYKEQIIGQKRKLLKGEFTIDKEISLNH
jgi:hypothetical protein